MRISESVECPTGHRARTLEVAALDVIECRSDLYQRLLTSIFRAHPQSLEDFVCFEKALVVPTLDECVVLWLVHDAAGPKCASAISGSCAMLRATPSLTIKPRSITYT